MPPFAGTYTLTASTTPVIVPVPGESALTLPGVNPKMTAGNGSPAIANSVSRPVAPSMIQVSQSWLPSRVVVWM